MKLRVVALFACLGSALTLLAPTAASASVPVVQQQPVMDSATPTGDRWERRLTIWGHGLATPFGTLAVSADYSPVRYLALEVGVGADPDGLQAGALPRLRLPIFDGFAVSLGPTIQVGNYDPDDECFMCVDREFHGPYRSWHPAFILGGVGGIEGRTEGGLSWRLYLGRAGVLNRNAVTCTEVDPAMGCSAGDSAVAYFGIAMGYAFE